MNTAGYYTVVPFEHETGTRLLVLIAYLLNKNGKKKMTNQLDERCILKRYLRKNGVPISNDAPTSELKTLRMLHESHQFRQDLIDELNQGIGALDLCDWILNHPMVYPHVSEG
jgi:hypothetical protein